MLDALYVYVYNNPSQLALTSSFQVEFDSPGELLKKENGLLRSLVEESEDRDVLYAMAAAGQTSATGGTMRT